MAEDTNQKIRKLYAETAAHSLVLAETLRHLRAGGVDVRAIFDSAAWSVEHLEARDVELPGSAVAGQLWVR